MSEKIKWALNVQTVGRLNISASRTASVVDHNIIEVNI